MTCCRPLLPACVSKTDVDREIEWQDPGPARRVRWLVVASAMLLVLVAAIWKVADDGEDRDIWYTARIGTLTPIAIGTGQFVSVKQRLVTSTESATVAQLLRRPGEMVAKGDVVMLLDSPTLVLERADAQIALADAKDDLEALRAEIALESIEARRALAEAESEQTVRQADHEAYRALLETGVISRLQFVRSEADLRLIRSKVDSLQEARDGRIDLARIRLEQAQGRVARMQDQLHRIESRVDRLSVQAAEAGVLKSVLVELGSSVQPGSSLFSVGPELPDMATLEFPQGYISALRPGMPVELSYNNRTAQAELVNVSGDLQNGYGLVEARPISSWEAASIGMLVRAQVRLPGLDDAIHIPVPEYRLDLRHGLELRRQRAGEIQSIILDDVLELDGYLVFPSEVREGDRLSLRSPSGSTADNGK